MFRNNEFYVRMDKIKKDENNSGLIEKTIYMRILFSMKILYQIQMSIKSKLFARIGDLFSDIPYKLRWKKENLAIRRYQEILWYLMNFFPHSDYRLSKRNME